MTTTVSPTALGAAPVKTVLICDDRPSFVRLLARTLTAGGASDIVGGVTNASAVADAYTARPADVVLIGVHRGSSTGLDALGSLLGVHPAAVIVFGATRDAELLTAVVARGARGLMLWEPTGLNPPARALPAVPLTGLTGPGHSGAGLTERERQILLGMSEGKSNSVIGRDLFLTEDTIKSNTRQLFLKLGARDRAHAVLLGLRHDLLS